jgi:ankyrin repeat protein
LTQAKEQDAKNPEVWLTSALLEEDPLEALAALNQALALDEDLIEAQALQKDLENALLEQIFNQVNAGETVLLKKALSKGLVNAETSFQGQSLMAQAIEKEQIGLMSELLVATSTSRSADGGPAQPWLFEAARQNKTKAAALLINKGARADLPREDGQTPLSVAASAGAKQVMTLFLKDATEDLDASEALLIAVQEDDFVMAKAILQSKAKADPRDEEGNNLLMMGLMDENQDLVNLLLDNRFPLNQQNNSGETALSLVAKAQNNDLTQQFLKMGAEPEPALQALDQEDAEWLAGELFAYALDNDNNDWISLSLNYDPNIPLKQHSSGKSYLSYALAAEKWGLCAALLSNGQLPLDAEIDGENFLFKAVEAEAVPVVQALAEQEAIDLNQTNEQGLTSLHLAVDKGNLDLVQVLVQGGHDLEPTDSRDNTPLHRSLILGQVEIAEYLSSEEHLYEVKNNRSQHPIHLAVRESQLGVVRNLLANDTDVNLLGESGMTPLHYAAEERNYEMAQFLVEQGADLSIRDDFGRAPRKIARDNNDKNLYELVKGDLRDRIPEINMPEIKKPKVKLPKVFRRNN